MKEELEIINKIKRVFVILVAILLVVASFPISSFASSGNDYKLYQLIQDISTNTDTVNDGVTLKSGMLFYSIDDNVEDNFIPFTINGEEIIVPLEQVNAINDNIAEIPSFKEEVLNDSNQIITLSEETQVFSDQNREHVIATLPSGFKFTKFTENDNYYSIILGNREGFIFKEDNQSTDLPKIENTKDSLEQEEAIQDDNDVILEEDSKSDISEQEKVEEVQEEESQNETLTEDNEMSSEEELKLPEAVQEPIEKKMKISSNFGFTANDKYFKVINSDLPIYDNRTGELEKVGNLVKGQVFPIVGELGNWHKVKFGDIYGYVHKSGTAPATNNAKNLNANNKNSGQYITIGNTSPVYDNSSGTIVKFASIQKGVTYPLISHSGNWFTVDIAGRIGHIYKNNVKDGTSHSNTYFEVLTDDLTVYDNRSGSLKPIGYLKKGQTFKKIANSGNWTVINHNGFKGYVWTKSTRPAGRVSSLNTGVASNGNQVKTFDKVNVYDNSSGKLVHFGTIESGQTVNIISYAGDWWKIDFGGRIGYIYKFNVDPIFKNNYFEAHTTTAIYDNSTGKLVKVGEVIKGEAYQWVRDAGRWHEIKFGNGVAYVKKNYTQPIFKVDGEFNNNRYKNSVNSVTMNNDVIVYDNSSGKLIPFARIEEGKSYPVIDLVGNWYRIDVAGHIGYVHKSGVTKDSYNTNYNFTQDAMLTKQMNVNPQTDEYYYDRKRAYISAAYVVEDPGSSYPKYGRVQVRTNLKIQASRSTDDSVHVYGSLKNGDRVRLLEKVGDWYTIELVYGNGWYNALPSDVKEELNTNINMNSSDAFQFLVLSQTAGINESDLAKLLKDKGALSGQEEAFINAGKQFGINEIYLVSHALLETGNGTSDLAKGILVDTVAGKKVEPKVVYNMFGYNAKDSCVKTCGSEFAYNQGWTSPEKAILGGAELIAKDWIYHTKYKQDTLYEMRWNPKGIELNGYASHQYATDIGWATKQSSRIAELYKLLDNYTLTFDVPVYK